MLKLHKKITKLLVTKGLSIQNLAKELKKSCHYFAITKTNLLNQAITILSKASNIN